MRADALPGRTCPVRYRYGATALAGTQEQDVGTLYVVGGLYGNLPALQAIDAMVTGEPHGVTVCFNGDFNWFNVDDEGFVEINRSVLAHHATQGNVEAELLVPGDAPDCGCAYPESVDAGTVDRSNAIHARLKSTSRRHPDLVARLADLPMFRRYRIGDIRVAVVHGDADSLAGWRFDPDVLDDPANRGWIDASFAAANVDIFASTHTCRAAMRCFGVSGMPRIVANNGAAGMPNFRKSSAGLITRISRYASPHATAYGLRVAGLHVDALPVIYDQADWEARFLGNWPAGSPAFVSYYDRIVRGPRFGIETAKPLGACE